MSAGPAGDVANRLRAEPAAARLAAALPEQEAWLVGGAVRNAALGRPVTDVDVAVAGDPERAARAIAEQAGGHAFELSHEFATWRAAAHGGGWQVDVTPLRGGGIEEDLAARDFTVGAIAVPLAEGAAIDPHDGLGDLDRGMLRAVSDSSFAADPLRLLRAARIAAELALKVDPGTVSLARREAGRAGEPAGERQLAELRLLLGGPDPLCGLALMDELEVTAGVIPELQALRGVEQNPNHHLDVHGHTIAVLENWLALEEDLGRVAGDRASELSAMLAEPLADGLTRAGALRFGAVLHDAGKPATRGERGGYVTFIGHDRVGATIAAEFCSRMRTSRRLSRHLQGLTLHHLRLGFLVHERPLARRRIHEYLRATEPVSVDVTLLTVADRLAARGEGPLASEEMIEAHIALAGEMVAAGLDWREQGPPPPLLAGDEISAELGIEPGPRLGSVLAELEAAQYAGDINTREGALTLARQLISSGDG